MNNDTLKKIVSEYGTPTYIFDTVKLNERIKLLRECLPANTGLCFAMKANPFITAPLSEMADRLEVCSPGEYEICISEHISPEMIIVSGVNKTEASMKRILSYSKGAGIYTIESEYHYHILKKCSMDLDKKLRVILRLSSGNQFGMDEATLTRVLENIKNDDSMEPVGIHYYSGTQKKKAKIASELSQLDELGKRLREKFDLESLMLEYGPGLMTSYFEEDKNAENDDDDAKEQLQYLGELLLGIHSFTHITIELGRFIASGCGYFMTRIMDIKHTDGNNFIIADGGIHQLSYYGQMLGMKKPFMQIIEDGENDASCEIFKTEDNPDEKWTICGSLCTVNDILVRNVTLPSFNIGDIIVFERCGAYSVTEGMALFLSRELPQVLLLSGNGSVKIMRKRFETFTLNKEDQTWNN